MIREMGYSPGCVLSIRSSRSSAETWPFASAQVLMAASMASLDSSVDSCGCSVSSGRSTCCGRCALWHSSSISASEQMMVALPSWIRRLQPVLCGMVMSPGTANRLRLSSFAQPAVLSAPERARACATIRVDDNAAIRRLRSRNRLASGTVPGTVRKSKRPNGFRSARTGSGCFSDRYGSVRQRIRRRCVPPERRSFRPWL